MEDRDFSNYQRILASYPVQSITVLGLFITLSLAGFGGVFAIGKSGISTKNITIWIGALSTICFAASVMLGLIWYREHTLKDKVVEELKSKGVLFPVTPSWIGVTSSIIKATFIFGALIWMVVLIIAVCWPALLEMERGL